MATLGVGFFGIMGLGWRADVRNSDIKLRAFPPSRLAIVFNDYAS